MSVRRNAAAPPRVIPIVKSALRLPRPMMPMASAAVPIKAAVVAQNGVEPIRLPSSSQTTRHREKRGQLQRTG